MNRPRLKPEFGWTKIDTRLDHLGLQQKARNTWCKENLAGGWTWHYTQYFFENKQDAALFALTWL